MTSDAIVLLKADHNQIRRLFRQFQAAGDRAVKTKARLAGKIIELLTGTSPQSRLLTSLPR